jgi:hypothetical protein
VDDINPIEKGDQSNTSSNVENIKKSFNYGIEDIKNNDNDSQMLNLNITKHNESVRDAPLSNCNSMKAK